MRKVVDVTKFKDLLGYGIEIKILELFVEGVNMEYTFNDVINIVKVNRKRGYELLRFYSYLGIIKKGTKFKHIQTYTLHKHNKISKSLLSLYKSIILNKKLDEKPKKESQDK